MFSKKYNIKIILFSQNFSFFGVPLFFLIFSSLFFLVFMCSFSDLWQYWEGLLFVWVKCSSTDCSPHGVSRLSVFSCLVDGSGFSRHTLAWTSPKYCFLASWNYFGLFFSYSLCSSHLQWKFQLLLSGLFFVSSFYPKNHYFKILLSFCAYLVHKRLCALYSCFVYFVLLRALGGASLRTFVCGCLCCVCL